LVSNFQVHFLIPWTFLQNILKRVQTFLVVSQVFNFYSQKKENESISRMEEEDDTTKEEASTREDVPSDLFSKDISVEVNTTPMNLEDSIPDSPNQEMKESTETLTTPSKVDQKSTETLLSEEKSSVTPNTTPEKSEVISEKSNATPSNSSLKEKSSIMPSPISPILETTPKVDISATFETPRKGVLESFDPPNSATTESEEEKKDSPKNSSVQMGFDEEFPEDEQVNDSERTPSPLREITSGQKRLTLRELEEQEEEDSPHTPERSYLSLDGSITQTPHKHIPFEDMTPIKYREYPGDSEPSPEHEYYDEVYNSDLESNFDGSELEDEEENRRDSRINLRRKIIPPVNYWEGERPE
jgi:hypothetical protein